ncbi:hypothetical protein U8V72_21345 [Priestia filamentosa]|uniref:hypothetical protein n=1 Tax=Priestia filamentosa TaxID=1402861 RepID=UPI00397CD43D
MNAKEFIKKHEEHLYKVIEEYIPLYFEQAVVNEELLLDILYYMVGYDAVREEWSIKVTSRLLVKDPECKGEELKNRIAGSLINAMGMALDMHYKMNHPVMVDALKQCKRIMDTEDAYRVLLNSFVMQRKRAEE